ncbi:MAG: hypothetical protein WDN28_32165 [Chthoniobacter sp.]
MAARGGVAFVGGFDVGLQQLAHDGQGAGEFFHDRRGLAGGALGVADADALAHLLLQAADDGDEPLGSELRQRAIEDGVVIVQAGEKDLEEVFADLPDGPLGGHVVGVEIVQAAEALVGSEQLGEVPVRKLVHAARAVEDVD